MTTKNYLAAVAAIFLAAGLPACGDSSQINDELEFTSQDKPDLIALPILCRHVTPLPADVGAYPTDRPAMGVGIYHPATVVDPATRIDRDDREALIAQVAVALSDLDAGKVVADEVLTAVGSVQDWIEATDLATHAIEVEPPPHDALMALSVYFDDLRPCNHWDRPVAK